MEELSKTEHLSIQEDMTSHTDQVRVVRAKSTRHGLLILFSDGQVFLFHSSFLVQNRLQHADRIVNRDAIESLLAETTPPSGADVPGKLELN